MNLRQKIKKAKRELEILKRKNPGSNVLKMAQHFKEMHRLQEIVNHKRNLQEPYQWDEKPTVNMEKLTYVSFHSDYKDFGKIVSPNGKPLDSREVNAFIGETIRTKVMLQAEEVANMEMPTERFQRKHVDYYLLVSSDKTKSKKLMQHKILYQRKNDHIIYLYANEGREGNEIEEQTEKTS